jgi:hypothetical protein
MAFVIRPSVFLMAEMVTSSSRNIFIPQFDTVKLCTVVFQGEMNSFAFSKTLLTRGMNPCSSTIIVSEQIVFAYYFFIGDVQ